MLIIFALAGTGYFAKKYLDVLSAELPSLEQLENYNPELVTKVYSKDGKLIKELFTQKRDLIPLNEIPLSIQNAILATEDRKFYGHWGIDIQRILGAAFINLVTLNFTQGASTLTQQLARNLYLTREKSITRKVKEILTSLQIEKTYSKKEILEMYLNTVYFGHGAYGIKSAAQKYFHKDVSQITIEEAALLASQLKAPTHYSPLFNPERALARRNTIINGMFEAG
ncbi:transglycosylase domain-containing protein, partial [bacterium]|nr:transglycosylase domain-containing protein [bacterium]